MKKTIEEHAAHFSEMAADYDDSQNSEEYRACASLVVEHAAPGPDDVVLDLGAGTGAIALALAPRAKRVVGRDISEGMLERAREKAAAAGIENVEFGYGTFREPEYGGSESTRSAGPDVVVSNFAMHHLSDDEKREAIEVIAGLGPRKFVLGDVMFFGEPNPDEPFYSPEVDDPATVGTLVDALTDAGFALTAVERVHDQVGVLVAERAPIAGTAADAEAVGGDPEGDDDSPARE
ncbi:class I SAM-dependent methyltransferase [Halegenticoccus soli]|uniref:class I SAM-dependent methyltransferase n=1 Tax=Halegenticoccus soli TaxID=1985678 RepID=UPI000C6E8376|nr:class I SAM-dependent methyltransferase [Halegenticoccus soli]